MTNPPSTEQPGVGAEEKMSVRTMPLPDQTSDILPVEIGVWSRDRVARTTDRWGVINPWSQVWTSNTFDTRDDAVRYVAQFWGREGSINARRFTFERVCVEVSRLSDGPLEGQDDAEGTPT